MGAACPFEAERGLGSCGLFIRHDLYGGGGFTYDPWALYPDTALQAAITDRTARGRRSMGAGGGPDVDVAVCRVTVDLGQLVEGEVAMPKCGDVLV